MAGGGQLGNGEWCCRPLVEQSEWRQDNRYINILNGKNDFQLSANFKLLEYNKNKFP
jgi:hypothetical protein